MTDYHKYKVGEGATLHFYSDRHAATVVDVSPSGKTVRVQRDFAHITNGQSIYEQPLYEFAQDPEGVMYTMRLSRKNGKTFKNDAEVVLTQGRSEYYDPSF